MAIPQHDVALREHAVTGLGPPERIQVTDATPGLLALLGVSPVLGRTFAEDDRGQAAVS